MLGIKHKSPLNDSYTDPPATHVAMAPYYTNMANAIAANIGSRTDEEKDQAREDKLKRKEDRKKRKGDRLKNRNEKLRDKRDPVYSTKTSRIDDKIDKNTTKINIANRLENEAATELKESQGKVYSTSGEYCPYGLKSNGTCKTKAEVDAEIQMNKDTQTAYYQNAFKN